MAIIDGHDDSREDAGPEAGGKLPRVLRTGRSIGRTLYDAETDALVGMVDTPELAHYIAACVWRQASKQPLAVGEQIIPLPVCAALSALYDEPRGPATSEDSMSVTYGVDPLLAEADRSMPPEGMKEDPRAYAVQTDPAEELVWNTRRLLDAQWDVAQALARVQAQRP